MSIIAIDPGPIQSAFVEWDGTTPLAFGIHQNSDLLQILRFFDNQTFNSMVIEQVECFGMPVGKSIFETVFWTGRFWEACCVDRNRMPRKDVKLHLCGQTRAKDSNIIQALVDRFAPFTPNKGKGKKAVPGFFYGFKSDIWQAMALAVTYWDVTVDKTEVPENRK